MVESRTVQKGHQPKMKLAATLATVGAIVMTASSQAQHYLPMPNRAAADAVFKREAQRRAEREAQSRAYVPPPPAPNSTLLPRDNGLGMYPPRPTSGNGCGGI